MEKQSGSRRGNAENPHLLNTDTVVLKPLVWFYNWFYGALVRPDDPFYLQVRKATIAVLFVASVSVFFVIQRMVASPSSAATTWGILYLTSQILRNALCAIPAYFYCRFTKSCPDALFTVYLGVQLLCEILSAVRSPGADLWSSTSAYAFMAIAGQARFRVLLLVLGLVAIVINQANKFPKPLMAVANAPVEPATDNTIINAVGIFLIMCLWIHLTSMRFNSLLAASKKAVKLSVDIAHMLRDYDTDGVTTLLREYELDEDKNGELVSAFEDINANLEKYRPHLPNYVLARDGDGDEEDSRAQADNGSRSYGPHTATGGDPHAPSSAHDDTHSVSSQSRGVAGDPSGPSPAAGATIDTARSMHSDPGGESNNKYGRTAAAPGISLQLERPTSTHASICLLDIRWKNYHSPLVSNADAEGRRLSEPLAATASSTHAPTTSFPAPGTDMFNVDRCNHIVTAMNDIARATQASIHGFVGDRLVATWNATRKVAKPEAKACGFADQFRRQCTAAGVSTSGVVCSGRVMCMFAGSAKLKTFVCSSTRLWSRAATALRQTHRFSTTVVDHATRDTAAYDFATRGVGLLAADPAMTTDESTTEAEDAATTEDRKEFSPLTNCLYELLHERPASLRDQEWMYVLDGHSNDPNELVSQALQCLALGHVKDAVDKMNALDASLLALQGVQAVQAAIDDRLLKQ